jgi:hypothetical protein
LIFNQIGLEREEREEREDMHDRKVGYAIKRDFVGSGFITDGVAGIVVDRIEEGVFLVDMIDPVSGEVVFGLAVTLKAIISERWHFYDMLRFRQELAKLAKCPQSSSEARNRIDRLNSLIAKKEMLRPQIPE